MLADQAPEHGAHLVHDRVEVHQPRLQHLLPAEGQELARRAPAARWAARPISCRSSRRGSTRGGAGQQQLGAAQDGREQVVEIVRDAAGELADRLHLLRLPELVLEALPVGDVPEVRQQRDRTPIGVGDDREVEIHPEHAAVGPGPPGLEVHAPSLARHQPIPPGALGGNVVGVQERAHRGAEQAGLVDPEQPAQARRDLEPAAVQAQARGHHQRERLGPRELLPALHQLVLDPEPLDRAAAVVGELLQRGEDSSS